MIKTISKSLISLALCSIAFSSAFAGDEDFVNKGKQRFIFGLGVQFDPNGLGGTILKDGLNSNQPKTDANGNYAGQQQAIIPDNKLQAAETLTGGLINYKSSGPMTLGNLALGYERDVKENFFFRVGINFSTKIMGGHTTSNFLGYNWYDVRWFYKSTVIPVYFGIKINFGSRSAFYVGPGVHYYDAEWQLKGKNDGTGLDAMTAGAAKNLPVLGDAARPGVLLEDTKFAARGYGLNWLWGAQTKITNNGYLFFEVETFFSGSMANGQTKSTGGIAALSQRPAYPVLAAGNVYRFGYKHEF
jgi:hypothetical protein